MERNRFPGRRTVKKVRRRERRGRRASDRAEERLYSFRFDLGEREEQVVCHASTFALAMTDEVHREAEMEAW